MKRKAVSSFLVIAICIVFSCPVFADVCGGWDEDNGYFETISAYKNSITLQTTNKENDAKHIGKREREEFNGTTHFRAHGWTTWVGVYHYTRARMEEHYILFDDKILTDSGRIWGNDGTEAKSPWWKVHPSVNDKARTYYGN